MRREVEMQSRERGPLRAATDRGFIQFARAAIVGFFPTAALHLEQALPSTQRFPLRPRSLSSWRSWGGFSEKMRLRKALQSDKGHHRS